METGWSWALNKRNQGISVNNSRWYPSPSFILVFTYRARVLKGCSVPCMCGDTHATVSAELTSVGTCDREDGVEGKDWRWGATVCTHTTLAPGYSLAVLHKAHGVSYVAGAPRHKLRGAVFELQKEDREDDAFVRRIEGEQVPPGEVTFPPPEVLGRGMGPTWARLGSGCKFSGSCVCSVGSFCGDSAIHPSSPVTPEIRLTQNNPSLVLQEEYKQRLSLREGWKGGSPHAQEC